MKIAVIGDKTSVAGFKALGIDTFEVPEGDASVTYWNEMKPADYAVIFVTEGVYEELAEDIASFKERFTPAISVIPSVKGSKGIGRREIRALVEKAVGADILERE